MTVTFSNSAQQKQTQIQQSRTWFKGSFHLCGCDFCCCSSHSHLCWSLAQAGSLGLELAPAAVLIHQAVLHMCSRAGLLWCWGGVREPTVQHQQTRMACMQSDLSQLLICLCWAWWLLSEVVFLLIWGSTLQNVSSQRWVWWKKM